MLKKLLNEKELSELTGQSLSKIRQDRHKGIGCPYAKLGRSIRYIETDVDAFVSKCRIDPKRKVET